MRDATAVPLFISSPLYISIHASHAGRDNVCDNKFIRKKHFNPRVPCGTRRQDVEAESSILKFQSTRPMRDATISCHVQFTLPYKISIHASHAGRDATFKALKFQSAIFQSTRPMRDATALTSFLTSSKFISIHASHAGRDKYKGFA